MTSSKDFFSKAKERMSLKVAQMNLMSVYLINNIAIHVFKGFWKFQAKKIKSNRNDELETASA